MNRRERRNVEKSLGLQKYRKNETRQERWERLRGNQENGKRMMQDKATEVATSIQEQEDQKASDVIQSLAEGIAKRKQIPLMDAMLEAKNEYEKLNNNS